MKSKTMRRAAVLLSLAIPCVGLFQIERAAAGNSVDLDSALVERLRQLGFTGNVEATLENRLGRAVDPARANLGRLLWFDMISGLNNDNSCAGCHSPTRGFGDSQSIAIGIDNNGIVGPDRRGPPINGALPWRLTPLFIRP